MGAQGDWLHCQILNVEDVHTVVCQLIDVNPGPKMVI